MSLFISKIMNKNGLFCSNDKCLGKISAYLTLAVSNKGLDIVGLSKSTISLLITIYLQLEEMEVVYPKDIGSTFIFQSLN